MFQTKSNPLVNEDQDSPFQRINDSSMEIQQPRADNSKETKRKSLSLFGNANVVISAKRGAI